MNKINTENFDFLGVDYEDRLIAQLLVDSKFTETIIDILNPNYFSNNYSKIIVATIKEAYQKDKILLDSETLKFRLLNTGFSEIDKKFAVKQLESIHEVSLKDPIGIQRIALDFCRTKELSKVNKKIQEIIDSGDISRFDECEEMYKKAMQMGKIKDSGINIFENIENVLEADFRKPIPTGIKGLDEIMDGGLSKQELGLILAPLGIGKTTMVTKMANHAYNLGYNVLQIFFEDTEKIIQRKHIACWTGYHLNELSIYKDDIIQKINKEKEQKRGKLILKKFPSAGVTMNVINSLIIKLKNQGIKIDLVLLDYIDVVHPSKKYDDVYFGEGVVMREFETLLSEHDMAGWAAVQGNRSSIKSEIVQSDQMGGSIKKAQIGHFILSIQRTIDQKDSQLANIAILKSRIGRDGIIFENVKFDNARVDIDMTENIISRSQKEYNKDKEKTKSLVVQQALRLRENALNSRQENDINQ